MDNEVEELVVLNKEHVFILDPQSFYRKVCIHDIIYLEAQQNYCDINMDNREKKVVSVPLCEVLDKLDSSLFVRIHRSYAINIEHVSAFSANCIQLDNGKMLTIGRNYSGIIESKFILIGSRDRVKNSRNKDDK